MIEDFPPYKRHHQRPSQTSDGVMELAHLGAVDRLDRITRIGRHAAQAIIAAREPVRRDDPLGRDR